MNMNDFDLLLQQTGILTGVFCLVMVFFSSSLTMSKFNKVVLTLVCIIIIVYNTFYPTFVIDNMRVERNENNHSRVTTHN